MRRWAAIFVVLASALGVAGPGVRPAVAAVGAWSPTAELPGPRTAHTATLLANGKVLVAGGLGGGFSAKAGAFLYDPAAGTWATTGLLNTARYGHTASRLNDGRVLVVGGSATPPDGAHVELASAELYDPASGTWSPAATLPSSESRTNHTATVLPNGQVLVVGGSNGATRTEGELFRTTFLYDATTNSWLSSGLLVAGREDHTANLLPSGDVLVLGGYRGHLFNTAPTGPFGPAELFHPSSGTWEEIASNPIRRYLHTATTLPDGTVLVTGGYAATGEVPPTPSSELFSPATPDRLWRPVGSLATARAQHTATLLPGGRVLVVGGLRDGVFDGVPVATAELYDPGTQRWSDAGSRSVAANSADAAFLDGGACGAQCGKVLVIAGAQDFNGFDPVTNADLYSPPPEVTGLAPTSGPVGGGNTVVITGGGFTGATAVRFGDAPATRFSVDSHARITAVAPPHAPGAVDVVVTTPLGTSAVRDVGRYIYSASGYWLTASDGGVFAFGDAGFFGSTGALRLNQPVVGMAATPSGNGYWLVASDGGVFAFGNARFWGSTGALRLNKPVVGMAPTPSGNGYWLVASDGGVFAFGDARFLGSTGNLRLNQPMVAMASTPTGRGYWLVASDGGVFAFGDARFLGSTGSLRLNKPMVGAAASVSGNGYWLVASDGGVFAFGDARFLGSTGAITLNQPMVAMASSKTGNGYWLVASDGGVFAFGDAFFAGSTGALRLNKPMVGMARRPSP